MLRKLLTTSSSDTLLLTLRVALALLILPHGLQKTFGFFGGYGWSGTLGYFDSLGVPHLLGILGILAESLGALMLLFGFLGRLAALGITSILAGAVLLIHLQHGFFSNWFGNQKGEGFEYFIFPVLIGLILTVKGPGAFSLDSLLTSSKQQVSPARAH